MQKITLRLLLPLAGIGIGLTGCSTVSPVSHVTPEGNDTYTIVRQAGTGFSRDTAKLRAEALQEAEKYCADHGKQMKLLSADEKKPLFYTTGYAEATVRFKALNPGDPELTAPAPAQAPPAPSYASSAPSYAPPPPVPERAITTDELYAELSKLDDLRKKGILTDEEFQAEKKKVLARSK